MKVHAPYTIDGKPILGTYVAQTLEALEAVNAVGMNMVIGGHDDLDPNTPTGAYCAEHGIGIQHHMTSHIYGKPRLQQRVNAEQTTIPIGMRDARGSMDKIPQSGIVQLDDETISYGSRTDTELLDCVRGYDNTAAAIHREGMYLFWPEACAKEVEEVKDMPNLAGYYVLDDSPGDALSALRAMYRIIRRIDTDRANHPVVAGYGSLGALCNFGPEVCDIMMLYWYPVSQFGYERTLTSLWTQILMGEARKQVPGMSFLGVYQSFDAGAPGDATAEPTAEQLRDQLEDFVREGASGLVAFLCHHEGMDGFAKRDYMREVISQVNREIVRTGGLEVKLEPDEMKAIRLQPTGFWEKPVPVPGVPPAWHVVGPFVIPEGEGFSTTFAPEREIDLDGVYDGKEGPIRWEKRLSYGGSMGLGELYGSHTYSIGTVTYATCTVASPSEQRVTMSLCTDDDGVIWLNGAEVYRFEGGRGLKPDEDTVEVTLPKGESRLLVKVTNRAGMHGFFLRFVTSGGAPLEGLEFSPEGA